MASDLENLKTIRTNLIAYLVTESTSPKPSYSAPNGQSVSWSAHYAQIMAQVNELSAQIGRDEPIEIISEVVT